jgi:tRNA(fMet)-specific endonuclease VapC
VVLFDSDIASIHQRVNAPEFPLLMNRIATYPDTVAVGIVTFEEQVRGWLAFAAKSKTPETYAHATGKLRDLLTYFSKMPVLPFDVNTATIFRGLKSLKPRAGTMDLRIAAVALAHGATLVTRNVRDFAGFPSLKVEDWTKG